MSRHKKIISVVGARPNFMKVAPIHRAFKKYEAEIEHLICHTGQHYDEKMSKVFFEDLELPQPDFYLGVGSGGHAEQTAKIMVEFEKVINKKRPDLVIVVGDVNSTVACSLVAAKAMIPIAHVEAGLRSFDRSMPEEINRVVTDALSDFLFVTEQSAVDNLRREGIKEGKIHFVGNVMIDSLIYYLPKAEKSNVLDRFGLRRCEYAVATFHRPSNVDSHEDLEKIVSFLNFLGEFRTIVFPVHPRTRQNISSNGFQRSMRERIILTEPLGYIDFLWLMKNAGLAVTDSGGIQEETTYLGVPCITLRGNTERPVTIVEGTNYLARDYQSAKHIASEVLQGRKKTSRLPRYWDGKAAERIVSTLNRDLIAVQ